MIITPIDKCLHRDSFSSNLLVQADALMVAEEARERCVMQVRRRPTNLCNRASCQFCGAEHRAILRQPPFWVSGVLLTDPWERSVSSAGYRLGSSAERSARKI
ncbi:hypothetical protein NDU88_007491 [Pleurodeles waltl]|uniref:Uncharacterized protein n=1 Tax=Pleurodeles waltl TaxID=8319 RepID=A0AAV7TZX0_PLEWA|nr:hypothetical protein NDU88_007491 [Pleurodeles waltl]